MRAHRWLLRLLPAWFRRRHGDAMAELFEELHAEAVTRGRHAVVRLWVRESFDVLRTGVSLRLGAYERSAHRRPLLSTLRDDFRYAVRSLVRHPAFVLLATLTLALGIGATTAMYSARRVVVLDPLPYDRPDQLVVPWSTMGSSGAMVSLEKPVIAALRERRDVFAAIEEYAGGATTITGHGEPRRVRVLRMSAGLPSLLGLEPLIGRTPSAAETAGAGERVVLLSHALWRDLYGGRRDIVGTSLYADGEPWTIIGVMPPRAPRPDGLPIAIDLWTPLPESDWNRVPIARLADGVTAEHAAAQVDLLVREMAPPGFGGTVLPVLREGPLHQHLRVLTGAVFVLLLIAGVNLSGLLLHRAATRDVETATRLALGAGRARVAIPAVIESVLLALVGGALGAALAHVTLQQLAQLGPEQLAILSQARVDRNVLLFCVTVSLAIGVIVGLVPAWHAAHGDAHSTMGRMLRATRTRVTAAAWPFVTVQVALTFVLLGTTALAVGLLRELAQRDPGFDVDGLIAVDVRLPSWRYTDESARLLAFEQMRSTIGTLPGIDGAALADGAPPNMQGRFGRVGLDDAPVDPNPIAFHSLSMDTAFLTLLGQPLIAGSGFGAGTANVPNPVLLAESAARQLFGSVDVVGRRFSLEGDGPYTIAGVVSDILPTGLGNEPWLPLAYWPLGHVPSQMTILVRTQEPDARRLLALRDAVRRVEPDAIVEVATIDERLGATLARERFTSAFLSFFATLALVLAGIGLYGVLSQLVAARTHEIGVRIALGATPRRIVGLVSAPGVVAIAAGLILGSPLLLLGERLLAERLPGTDTGRPDAWAIAAVVLLVTGLIASSVPATRAARLDPRRSIDAT